MSDYLGNLLKRSFAASAEIRPRVASVFEPPGLTDAGWILPATQPGAELADEPTLPSPRRRQARSNPEAVAPPGAPAMAQDFQPGALVHSTGPLARHREPAAATAQPLDAATPGANVRLAAQAPGISSRATPDPYSPAAAEPRLISANSTHEASRAPSATAFNAMDETAEPPSEFRGVRREAEFPSSSIASRRERSSTAAGSSGPTIQITIGRVEVRAAPTSMPVRPAAGKAPELTLDAYLRRRAEGGRR